MNKFIGIGNLAADPEMRVGKDNMSVATFRVGIRRTYTKDGEPTSDFFTCVAFKSTADFVCKYFKKGSPISFEGAIQNRTYTKKDGTKGYATDVIVDRVYFVPKNYSDSDTASDTQQTGKPSATYAPLMEADDEPMPF